MDTTPRYKNDNQSRQFGNQRIVNVVGARENVGSPIVQQSGIQYTDEEIDEYNVYANDLQHSGQSESVNNTCLVETNDSNVIPESLDMCDDAIQNDQNDVESDDERVALANLIANLKLDVDENKKIQNPYKPTTILVQAVAATDDSTTIPEHTTLRKCGKLSKGYNKGNPSIFKISHTTTRHKGKEKAKPITPPSETASEEDSDPEQAQRDKDTQKNLALIAKYFKNIYKPTNNNLITSSNSRNKNMDTTPRYKNDNQSGQFGNQRIVNVVGARENVGSPDSAYHKEKMLLCKQAEQGVPVQAEQYDWLADTDEEIDE
nr:hypothetical protein [Tanacetum cinerariifolium]